MNNIITVAIAEDNDIMRETLTLIVDGQNDMQLVGTAGTGSETIRLIREKQPQVMLLDMVMPDRGGMDVLKEMKNDGACNTKFIVVSSIGTEQIARDAFGLGASYYVVKPFTRENILDRVRMAAELVNRQMAGSVFENPALKKEPKADDMVIKEQEKTPLDEMEERLDCSLEQYITKKFITLGTPAKLIGFEYMREALIMSIEKPNVLHGITKNIYPVIAERHNVSRYSVEKNIRHAIEVSWTRGNKEAIEDLFGYTIDFNRGKPTNSEFIAMLADRIRMEIKA